MNLPILFFLAILSFESFGQDQVSLQNYILKEKKEYAPIGLFYKARNFRPLVIENGAWTTLGVELNQFYQKISDHGLILEDYGYREYKKQKESKTDLNLKSEIQFTAFILKMVENLIIGRVDPSKVSPDIKFSRKSFGNWALVNQNLETQGWNAIETLAPQSRPYLETKEILRYFKSAFSKDPSHPAVQFNEKLITDKILLAELQLEKCRWLPDSQEPRFGLVNLAAQTFSYVDTHSSETADLERYSIVIGTDSQRTLSLNDSISEIVLNPNWAIPIDVFFNSFLENIKRDLKYFDKNRFKIIHFESDTEINPESINWHLITRKNIYFQVIEKSNPRNHLGQFKFVVSNKRAMYLQGTNQIGVFTKPYRKLSSGPVWLDRPLKIAELLLSSTSWTKDKLHGLLSLNPLSQAQETHIALEGQSLPIYVLSLSLERHNGMIKNYVDIYNHNALLLKSLKESGFYQP